MDSLLIPIRYRINHSLAAQIYPRKLLPYQIQIAQDLAKLTTRFQLNSDFSKMRLIKLTPIE